MAQSTQSSDVSVEIPGKVILFGEHAVVYPGNHAILWPVRSMRVRVDAKVKLSLKDEYEINGSEDNSDFQIDFDNLGSVLDVAVQAHTEFLADGDTTKLVPYKDPGTYVQLCCSVAHAHVQSKKTPNSLLITIDSNIPIGGFGSSAAVAAGVIKAIVLANDLTLDKKTWFDLVMQAEKMQHGKPSGADPAVVTMQKPVIVAKRSDGLVEVEVIQEASTLFKVVESTRLAYTGKPAQSTGETVRLVAEKPGSRALLQDIEQNTVSVIKAIKENRITTENWNEYINTNGILLEQLGVVPEKFMALSSDVRSKQGTMKLSGGGATEGDSCGVMIYFASAGSDKPSFLQTQGMTDIGTV